LAWLSEGVPWAEPLAVAAFDNPLPVAPLPRELVMDEVADAVDDYFRIAREQRIQLAGNIMTEGWIETHPRIGSTVLEPWRGDSTMGFERVHATLQTVRRTARVRVIPTGQGYLVDVQVYKELEDLLQPAHSSISGRLARHDNTLDADMYDPPAIQWSKGWIPMGRDFSLEQKIVAQLQQRFESAVKASSH
jgi:hypothetical protein